MKIEDEIKQPKFISNNHKASLNLLFTANWLMTKLEEIILPYGITVQQFNILRILRGQGSNTISATEIKTRMLDKSSDVSRLLDRLELKKLISKKQNKYDKRATDISITDNGLVLLEKMLKEQPRMDSLLNISEDSAALLSSILDKLRS
jgi:DNA-binding MarR family transcriptional regulator